MKVVLTGEGSDEIFAGYPQFRRDMVLYGDVGQSDVRGVDTTTRTRADTLLMWVLSICSLHDRSGMSSGLVAQAA